MNIENCQDLGINVTSKVLRFNGKKIQTYVIGEGENVVVSLPPFPHSGIIYSLFMLQKPNSNIRLVTFDIPGWIGSSEAKELGEDPIGEMSLIAEEVLRELGIKRYSILGYSFGGAVGIHLANRQKTRINKLVLVSTIVSKDASEGAKDLNRLKLIDRVNLYAFVPLYLKYRFNLYYKPLLDGGIPEDFLKAYRDMLNTISSKYVLESLKELFMQDHQDELKNISDLPIMVVNSKTETQYFRKQAGCIRHLLGKEKSLYIEGNHEDFLLKPDGDTVKTIVKFLGS